uniref:DUF4283 domain-containing protein n=1 Tax=Tanacetum cinerariifolium TaxID=118510 RepID=A0A699GQF6_TANCI|nr:hypothetical protein [Tanacetum cinerariifolium]
MKLGYFASVVIANDVQVTSTNNEGYTGGNSCNSHSKPVEQVTMKVNFRSFVNEERLENYDTVLPKVAMENVKHKYANTLVGYFIGKSVAFALVQNYVNNTWAKFGLQKIMKNDNDVFLFKFATKDGLDKVLEQRSESYKTAPEHKELYEGLVKSYNLDKDLFSSYGKAYSLKRDREDKDKDEDPSTGSGRGLKKQKTSKDVEPPKGSNSKETKISSSKGTKVPQKWINTIAKTEKPPRTFDELMSTPIDFSTYVMHNLKIDNLTQEILVGPAFNLLKGTCKSFVDLEYHFEECYKAVTDQLDCNNPEGHEYPFNLTKPLPLIEAQGRQVVPADYFFNNDLEYLKGGNSSRKYTTSTTKTKATNYDNIEGIEDMVPIIIAVTHVKVMKWYDYGYLEEIVVRREDNILYKFMEGYFPRFNLRDIKDLLLLLVQKKLSNLEKDVIFDLNVALWMFTRRIVILKRLEDLQLGVESYQKKLNLTKPETFRSDIINMTPYTAYKNPQGIIYLDKYKRNMLMRSDELYKLCD